MCTAKSRPPTLAWDGGDGLGVVVQGAGSGCVPNVCASPLCYVVVFKCLCVLGPVRVQCRGPHVRSHVCRDTMGQHDCTPLCVIGRWCVRAEVYGHWGRARW